MGENSKIAWCDHTFNPWWGCTRVSPGCDNCYAEGQAARWGFDVWGSNKTRRFFGGDHWLDSKHWREPVWWNAKAAAEGVRRRVFCGSMCDVFEDTQSTDVGAAREQLFRLIGCTPNLIWLLLTKRPENMQRFAPRDWESGWPENVWAMATVENQAMAELRIRKLLQVPAAVRGLSCEPLLGPLDLRLGTALGEDEDSDCGFRPCKVGGSWHQHPLLDVCNRGISWVIAGGESGQHARPLHPDWVRTLRDQCQAADVAFFFKQWGEFAPCCHFPGLKKPGPVVSIDGQDHGMMTRVGRKDAGQLLDGRKWNEFPNTVEAAKGTK